MDEIWREALEIWQSGGWAMTVLAINAFILFSLGLAVKVRLWEKEYRHVSRKTCTVWIENPQEHKGSGAVRHLIEFVRKSKSMQQMAFLFKEFRQDEIAPFLRDIRIMRVCVGAAPLLGLLGTVSGMLTMFQALAIGSGGEKTLGMVASGISEALVTTETGLIIALPGLFFVHHLQQEVDRYQAFLARLETGCAQSFHRTFSRSKVSKPVLDAQSVTEGGLKAA
jgi:biopolymer transport protein ExbB